MVYAGSAHTLVPLSDDQQTSLNLLEVLQPSLMPEPGKRADLAVGKALQLLQDGALGVGRLLLISSDLSEEERHNLLQQLQGRSERLLILGIGTDQGAPIMAENGSLLKDAQGAILMPRRDAKGLSQVAQELGGRYQDISLDESDLRKLGLLSGPEQLVEHSQMSQLQIWADQGHWLLLPLLLLAACAGRRGWLLTLPFLFLVIPQNSLAWSLNDLWLRPDQQGQRLLEEQRPAEAAEHFKDPQWRGLALYQAGDYAAAAEQFAQGDSAAALYNKGNALARSNELEAALEAYNRALQLDPGLSAAETNKALIEEMLRQRQQQQQSGQQSSGADDDSNEQPAPGEPSSSAAEPQQSDSQAQQETEQTETGLSKDQSTVDQPHTSTEASAQSEQSAENADQPLNGEQQQALEQWLRQIPDDPGELLRRKFRYEQLLRQESSP